MARGFNPSRRGYPVSISVSNNISTVNQGGGNKLQGLAPTTNRPASLWPKGCHSRAWAPPNRRAEIVCMNTLGGIGRGRSQFNPSADGINCPLDCYELYIKSIYQDPDFYTCLDLTAIYLPLPFLGYTASQCVVDLFVSWGGPVMWVPPQGFRYTGKNVLSTGTSPSGYWGNFDFLLTQLPDILQIWAPDYYAALPNYKNNVGDPCTPTSCNSCADFGGQGPTPCTDLIIAAINRYHKTYPNQFYIDNKNGMQQSHNYAEVQNHGGDAVFPHSTPLNPQWWFYSGVGTGVFTSMGANKLIALNKFHAIKIASDAGFKFKLDGSNDTATLPTPEQMLAQAKFFYSQFISDIGDSSVPPPPVPSTAGRAFIDYLNPYWNTLSSTTAYPDYKGWAFSLCGARNQTDYDKGFVKIGTAEHPITDPRAFWSLFTAGTFTDPAPIVWKLQTSQTINTKSEFGIDTLLNNLTIDSLSASGTAYDMIQMLSQPNKQGGFCVEMLTSKNPTFYRYDNGAYIPCPNLNKNVQGALPWDCLFCEGVGPSMVTCNQSIF